MKFTSLHYVLFFAVVLAGIAVLRRREHKISWLLLAGCFFYGYWDWRFLALIGFTSIFDFYMGIQLGATTGVLRKRLLILDIAVNLGILCVFKYLNFFIDSANAVLAPLGFHAASLNILLPIGISFFVFEAMSYCIDIYRGRLEACTNWRHFALFIFFFPRMIAGPIIRPSDFLPQLARDIVITVPNVIIGAQLFLLGMTKKLVIADNLAGFVDLVFGNPSRYDGATIWQAVLAYAIQIFCDFSGYSDMAIGSAKILGFDLPINFRMPYLATSLTDFWRRWHISLSSWLRDYLYISLGGNRLGVARTYLNLLVTMVLGGLWHGASWNFVIWGALHGAGLAVHKAFSSFSARPEGSASSLGVRIGSWAATFLFVCFCWVFFRAQSSDAAFTCLARMLGLQGGGLFWLNGPFLAIVPVVVLAHVIGVRNERSPKPLVLRPERLSHLVVLFAWALGVFYLCATRAAPFIYFQF